MNFGIGFYNKDQDDWILDETNYWPIVGKRKVMGDNLESTAIAQLIVEIASDKLAEDIVMLDLKRIASFADYFVIMSAQSSRQIEALEKDITDTLSEVNVHRFNREGTHDSGWVLLDFSDVIVHIFGPEEREFFGLERLWSGASEVVRIL